MPKGYKHSEEARAKMRSARRCGPKEIAILNGEKTYFTGRPCKKGHISDRYSDSSSCVICTKDKAKAWVENSEQNRASRRLSIRNNYWIKKSVDPKEAEALRIAHDGKCACCGNSEPGTKRGWFVDHDHETGKPRGVVCFKCNTGLGMFHDSVELLEMAIAYLLRSRE